MAGATLLSYIGVLLASHMIADYPLQTNWMAENKHSERDALLYHSCVHGLVAFVLIAPIHIGTAAAVSVPFAAVHAIVDSRDLHIRWDQTAHFLTAIVFAFLVS